MVGEKGISMAAIARSLGVGTSGMAMAIKKRGTGEDKLNGPDLRGFQDQFFLLTGRL